MKLIDKDALVAEIERKVNICKKVVWDLRTKENKDYYQGKAEVYKETLDLLDTLEVKEVDLDSNIRTYLTNHFNIYEDGVLQSKKSRLPLSTYDIIKVAKHFFELGMSVSNKAEKEVEEEPYVMSDKGKFTTTTK